MLLLGFAAERPRADEIPNLKDPKMILASHALFLEKHRIATASDGTGAKTPDDSVTVDLKSRTLVQGVAADRGWPAARRAVRRRRR